MISTGNFEYLEKLTAPGGQTTRQKELTKIIAPSMAGGE
jgi:hypothetical protein